MCGEQANSLRNGQIRLGSPPRVRGTGEAADVIGLPGGITPACAGNSAFLPVCKAMLEDHPRVCGEQRFDFASEVGGIGSPPRVRGTVCSSSNTASTTGITPACAGNRLKKTRHFYILFCQIKRIHLV